MSRLKPEVSAADHHQGNINASIILVEYGDLQCPYCRRAHPLIKRLVKEKGNDFLFVFRNFPLRESHPYANAAALAAEAAGKQGKYWEMHDLIYEEQDKLDPDFLLQLAHRIKLDMTKFNRDSKSEELQNKIESDFESGIRSGVNGTPTFYLNGFKLLTYDETYKSLADAIELESEMKTH